MSDLTDTTILSSLLPFVDIKDQSVFLSLCKTTREWILHPSREKSHMLECLLLTNGCWKQVQTKRYELCEPARCVDWARRLRDENSVRFCYLPNGYTLDECCADDSVNDVLSTQPDVSSKHPDIQCESCLKEISNTSRVITETRDPCSITCWLVLRIHLAQEVIKHKAPSHCAIGIHPWRRLPDPELDRLSFLMRHFSPDWVCRGENFDYDDYLMSLGVYVPDTEVDTSPDWYIGHHVMMPDRMETVETLMEATRTLSREVFTFTDDCSDIFAFPWRSSKHTCYEGSITTWTWAPTPKDCELSPRGGEPWTHNLAPSMAFTPFVIRLLLTQPDFVERLCDVKDTCVTPSQFLSEAQDFRFHRDRRLFGYDMCQLLKEHSSVFKIPPEDFWNLYFPCRPDPTMSEVKLSLLCGNSEEAWLYACRSLGCYEKYWQFKTLDLVCEKYSELEPFDLKPLRRDDDREGDMAVLSMNIPPAQFSPRPGEFKGGVWASFEVGQRGGLLQLRKIGTYRP